MRADSNFKLESQGNQEENLHFSHKKFEENYPHRNSDSSMNLANVQSICSLILEKIIAYNEINLKKNCKISLEKYCTYDSQELQFLIDIRDYIKRLTNYIKCDKHILILSMMNLDKFLELNNDFILTKTNCYRYYKLI